MIRTDPNTAQGGPEQPEVGSVFVSNYPPYSFWRPDRVPEALEVMNSPPAPGATLGLYLHIPFCRERCKFCYYKVYIDKDNRQVKRYLTALAREVERYGALPSITGRPLTFVYFGGGTPSYPGSRDLEKLASRLKASIPWDGAVEIAFECEPGTFTRSKLEAIRRIGVTRLSLGVENFDDAVLKENGRAHLSKEIFRSIGWIRDLKFDQLNIDLIAGMVGETWDKWRETVRKAIELDADSVTIYQLELPYNTRYTRDILDRAIRLPVADWPLKREWHDYAFEQLAAAGYELSSAYTMVKKGKSHRFIYRDAVWHGTDMIGAGVASFGHINGMHVQNTGEWGEYLNRVEAGELPLQRALSTSPAERLTRELILQLKLGTVDREYFRRKFDADVVSEFKATLERLENQGMLEVDEQNVRLTRKGLLQADLLLPEFYAAEYRDAG